MDVDKPEYLLSSSGLASYMVVKKRFTSMTFVTEWLTYAQDNLAITDDASVLGSPRRTATLYNYLWALSIKRFSLYLNWMTKFKKHDSSKIDVILPVNCFHHYISLGQKKVIFCISSFSSILYYYIFIHICSSFYWLIVSDLLDTYKIVSFSWYWTNTKKVPYTKKNTYLLSNYIIYKYRKVYITNFFLCIDHKVEQEHI
jgi:hypothetical protein